jgi:Domain of unknown function (DUF4389)
MYPVTYEADYVRERDRLTTLFRLILAIPWLIVAVIYAIAVFVVAVIAWFALLIAGRYPEGLYNFNAGALRFFMRVGAWVSLQTDAWPSFGFGQDSTYPVRIQVAPRADSQSRLTTLFRLILYIPLYVLSLGIGAIVQGAAIAAWLTIVFRGYQPRELHDALAYSLGWTARETAYLLLLRDEYPPVGEGAQIGGAPAGGQAAASVPGGEPPPAAQ